MSLSMSAAAELAPRPVARLSGEPMRSAPTARHLGDVLERSAQQGRTELVFGNRGAEQSLGAHELLQRARVAAACLADLRIGPGTRVGLLLPTSEEFAVSLFGVLLSGAAAVVLPPPLPFGRAGSAVEHLARLARCAGLAGAIVAPGFETLAAEAGIASVWSPEQLAARSSAYRPRQIAADSPAVIQFTSGSTAAPRGAALSHRAIVAQLATVAAACGIGPHDVSCSWLPFYHDLGIGMLLMTVYSGMRGIFLRPEHFLADPLVWLEAISHNRATLSPAPNFAYALVAARATRERLGGVELSSWRIAYNGGEPVEPRTLEAFSAAVGPRGFARTALWPSYGLAEATLAVSLPYRGRAPRELTVDRVALADQGEVREVASDSPRAKRLISVGTPLPGITAAIVRGKTAAGGRGRVGEIHVAGPTLMSGYYNDPEATGRVLRGGWLATGDLGFIEDGELFITGRVKDLIIVRGRNFYPQDIEGVVNAVPGIRRGTAVAVARSSAAGEEVAIFAETKLTEASALAATAAAVEAAVAAELLVRPAVVALLPPTALPKTSSGKLQRCYTLSLHAAGLLPALHCRGEDAGAHPVGG